MNAPVTTAGTVATTETGIEAFERREQIRKAVLYLTKYMDTYSEQAGYLQYSDKTFCRDVVYGMGVALWGRKHEGPNGYNRTLSKLKDLL